MTPTRKPIARETDRERERESNHMFIMFDLLLIFALHLGVNLIYCIRKD